VHLTLAKDTLLDPAKRFAYDRFGPDVTRWQHCKTIRDFLVTGAQSTLPYYASSSIAMVAMGFLGFFEWGRYWRYLAFASLALFEFHTVTRAAHPSLPPNILTPVLNLLVDRGYLVPYLPFQTLQFAHKAIITLFIALNQLGPLFRPMGQAGMAASGSDAATAAQQMSRLEQIIGVNQAVAGQLLALDVAPFRNEDQQLNGVEPRGVREGQQLSPPGPSVRKLGEKLKEWYVLNEVRQQPEVKDAVARVMQRRSAAVGGGQAMLAEEQ